MSASPPTPPDPRPGRPFGYEPYAPPGGGSEPARPAVIAWFRVYALASAALYLMAAAETLTGQFSKGGLPKDRTLLFAVAGFAVVLACLHGTAAFAPYRPWGWMLGLVAICIGLPSCTAVVAVPLLIFWIRPMTKAAFRRL